MPKRRSNGRIPRNRKKCNAAWRKMERMFHVSKQEASVTLALMKVACDAKWKHPPATILLEATAVRVHGRERANRFVDRAYARLFSQFKGGRK